MADFKNTITAGNAKIWTNDLLMFYPDGDVLKYGPSASDIYNTSSYPLVTSLTTTRPADATHKMASASAAQDAYDYAYSNELQIISILDPTNNEGFVPRGYYLNGYQFLGDNVNSLDLDKADIGLSLVNNWSTITSGLGEPANFGSTEKYVSASYVAEKVNWVSSANSNPNRSVSQYAKELDKDISIELKGDFTGDITKSNGSNGSTWQTGNIEITTAANISPTLNITGTGFNNASTTFTNLADTTLTFDIYKASSSVSGTTKLSDSYTSTSDTTGGFAATPKAVKSAYDLANSALQRSGGTMTGDIKMGDNKIIGYENYFIDFNVDNITHSAYGDIFIKADSNFNETTRYLSLESGKNKLQIKSGGASTTQTDLKYNGNTVWHAGNDGNGSGLDADKLDGLSSEQFLRSDQSDTINGNITILNGHINYDNNYFTNKRFNMIENATPQYIILCENDKNNDVNGRIQLNRTSGNWQAAIIDVLISSTTIEMKGGTIKTSQVTQSDEAYELVSLTYNAISYVAIKYTGSGYPASGSVNFSGRIISTGLSLSVVAVGVTNVVPFDKSNKNTIDNNEIFTDGYHPNADKWTTARTLTTTLTGDVTGTASMSVDGSGNKTTTIATVVGNNSHTHSNYAEMNTTSSSNNNNDYLSISRNSASSTLYVNNASTGDVARFNTNESFSYTGVEGGSAGQVTMRNDNFVDADGFSFAGKTAHVTYNATENSIDFIIA